MSLLALPFYFGLTAMGKQGHLANLSLEYVHGVMFSNPSVVSSSIGSAVEGQFGNDPRIDRTEGRRLFINALMTLYWCFRLGPVARRNLSLEKIRDTETWHELSHAIRVYYATHESKP